MHLARDINVRVNSIRFMIDESSEREKLLPAKVPRVPGHLVGMVLLLLLS